MSPYRTANGCLVCDGQGLVAQGMGTGDQVFGMGGRLKKTEVRAADQFGIVHRPLAKKTVKKPVVSGCAVDPDQLLLTGLGHEVVALQGLLGPPFGLNAFGPQSQFECLALVLRPMVLHLKRKG